MAMISSNIALMIMLLSLIGLVSYYGQKILEEIKYSQERYIEFICKYIERNDNR